MPKLSITFPSGERVTHELAENTITIGRLIDNDLVIDDVSVSSHHAELNLTGGDYSLKDLGSTNGTRVNGEKTNEVQLQDGDVVTFGKVQATYASEIPSTKQRVLPEDQRTVEVANESHRPTDFTNASRFKTKTKKKDPAAVAIVSLAVVSILTFIAAMVMIFSIQAPI